MHTAMSIAVNMTVPLRFHHTVETEIFRIRRGSNCGIHFLMVHQELYAFPLLHKKYFFMSIHNMCQRFLSSLMTHHSLFLMNAEVSINRLPLASLGTS